MFFGNPLYAQRYFQQGDLIRCSSHSYFCLCSSLIKPFYRATKRLLHAQVPARQSRSVKVSDPLDRCCEKEPRNTPVLPNPRGSLLDSCAFSSAGHLKERIPPRLDPFPSSNSGIGPPRSDEGENLSDVLLPKPAKQPRSRYEKIRQHKEDKRIVRTLYNERPRGPWVVHDWRTPLSLLKQFHKAQDITTQEKPRSFLSRTLLSAQPRIHQKRAAEIKRPQIWWNPATFRNFVVDLATSSVDRLIQRQLYWSGVTHVKAVARILERLFEDIGRKALLTSEACNAAMDFFYKYRMIRKAQAIFDQADNLLTEIEPETVDIILRSTAVVKDLHHYTYILQSVSRRGFRPTGKTWVSLLMTVESSEVRNVIVQAMKKKGLLEDHLVLKQAVAQVIRHKLSSWLAIGNDAVSFVAFMDLQYGKQWLSVVGANKLLHEFGRTNDVREVMNLLETLIERGFVPDVITLNTLISLCSLYYRYDAVIDIICRFHHKHHLPLSEVAHRDLFKLAWSRRMYNFSRVIWRSACVKAITPFAMQTLVQRSLLESRYGRSKDETRSRGQIWNASAGAVVVGVSPTNRFDQTIARLYVPPGSSALEAQSEAEAGTEAGTEVGAEAVPNNAKSNKVTRGQIFALIEEDFATAARFRLVRNIADLLRDALARDREWQQSGVLKTQDTQWKRENALPVEIEPVFQRLSPITVRMIVIKSKT